MSMPPPPPPSPDKDDDLYKLSEEDKRAGLDAIEPLPGTLNLYIVRFRKQPIKVDLSLKDWASKLKTESKDCGVSESALTVALKRLHLIETEKLLEVSRNKEEGGTGAGADNAIMDSSEAPSLAPVKQSDAEKLVSLIESMHHEYFVDQHGRPFIIAKSSSGEVNEPLDLMDEDFVEYAMGLFFDTYNEVIQIPNVKNAATVLAYKAKRNKDPVTGEVITRPLFVRIAWQDLKKRDTILIDVDDSKRHIIKITKGEGFKVVTQNDIEPIFRRQHRLPLPLPTEFTDETLNEFLDLYQMVPRTENKSRRIMATGTMGVRMIPGIPHPIELPIGSKGGLKSSWVEAQKRMIDPSVGITQRLPENEDDFSLQGHNNYMIAYDNVKAKNVPKWLPDALCRYVYEQGSEKRQHYSNMKTVAFGSSGCAIVAGINKMFEEEDLLDRCIFSEWRRLRQGKYLSKEDAEKAFLEIQPKLLGYLCDRTSKALAIYEDVKAELKSRLTRMADFMIWGECFARVCGYQPYDFIKAYENNLNMQNVEIVQSSLVGKVLVSLVNQCYIKAKNDRRQFGTIVDLKQNKAISKKAIIVFEKSINELDRLMNNRAVQAPFNIDINKSHDWPKNPQKLSQAIRLIQSNLSDGFGIEVDMYQDHTGKITGHKNRMVVRITKDPTIAPAEDFDDEDKPSKEDDKGGRKNRRGKGKGDSPPGTGGEGMGASTSTVVKVSSDHALHALHALPDQEESSSRGKWSKASKATSDKTIIGAAAVTAVPPPTPISLKEVKSLETFENLDKLHPVCRSLVCVDWEYAEDSDADNPDVYLFAYVDTQGNQGVLDADNDFATPKDFAIAVNRLIESYDYSVAYWSRGRDSDRVTDLMQWHNFCIKVGAYSIVEPVSDYDHYPTIKSINNPNHRHIDAYLIHNQTFIKSGVYKGAIRSMKLDDVHLAAFPTRKMGKLPGVDGGNENDMPVEVQQAYCLRDAQMVYEIMTKANGQLLGVMQTIAEYIDRDIEYICHTKDMGYLVEPVLTVMEYPNATHWWDETYTGGLVQPPVRGRHKHAMGIDCVGMYPEIVINYNISSETVCCSCCEYETKARDRALTSDPEVDEKGYWICVKQEGLFPQFMKGLKDKRKEFKKLRDEAKSAEEYQQYDIAQLAIKLYMNASYGCFGFKGFKYADKRTAELITGIGRKFAMGAKEMAESEKHGFICIYGDTDGLLLIEKQDMFRDETFIKENIEQRVKPLIDECYQRFNLPIDNDRNFLEVTPVEKKQYFGINIETKKVIVKGLEGMKRDACRFNQEQFKLLMSNYEKGIDPIPDVKAGWEKLKKGEVTTEDLVIKAKLSKDAEDYPTSNPLGKVARACNGKRHDVVSYYLTGVKGNAYSPEFEHCDIEEYKNEHLTDIGKVLYAMGYDIDTLYGPEMQASKKLLKRREQNDKKQQNKKKKKKKKQNQKQQQQQQEVLEFFDD
jgi:hypothetical protein